MKSQPPFFLGFVWERGRESKFSLPKNTHLQTVFGHFGLLKGGILRKNLLRRTHKKTSRDLGKFCALHARTRRAPEAETFHVDEMVGV